MTPSDHDNLPKPEFSRCVRLEQLGLQDYSQDIEATEEELQALAQRMNLDRLDYLKAHVIVRQMANDEVVVNATFSARTVQSCVVTLEPIDTEISVDFSVTYSEDAEEYFGAENEDDAEFDRDFDPPEPIFGGVIDIGEAISEHLALEIDPFPRVKGATFDGYSTVGGAGQEDAFEKKNPFAVLSKLKDTPNS